MTPFTVGERVNVRDEKGAWWPGVVHKVNEICVFVEVQPVARNGRRRFPAGCSQVFGRFGAYDFAIRHSETNVRIIRNGIMVVA